jgi:hypothetical protein
LGEAAGQPDRLPFLTTPLVTIRILQGRPGEVPELVAPMIKEFPGVIGYPALLAWALAEDGQAAEARAVIERLRPDGFAGVPRDYIWLLCICSLSRACSRLGDTAIAGELYDLLLPHRTAITTTQSSWMGPVTHDLGLLASVLERFTEADDHFGEAVARQDRIGARAAVIHTRIAWARMLGRRGSPGDADRARHLLEEAEAGALHLNLPLLSTVAARLREG